MTIYLLEEVLPHLIYSALLAKQKNSLKITNPIVCPNLVLRCSKNKRLVITLKTRKSSNSRSVSNHHTDYSEGSLKNTEESMVKEKGQYPFLDSVKAVVQYINKNQANESLDNRNSDLKFTNPTYYKTNEQLLNFKDENDSDSDSGDYQNFNQDLNIFDSRIKKFSASKINLNLHPKFERK
mmetsp:Transcript_4206/g.3532  ORF Transcript_4206/g.3532 Transcript_4206/m.3532 type:complete len:181 (-) Transcript_4206:183-725(-)